MEIAVRVQDPSAEVTRDVTIRSRDKSTVADLLEALVNVMGWPRADMSGNQIRYGLKRGDGDELLPDATVASVGLEYGDLLILGPAQNQGPSASN